MQRPGLHLPGAPLGGLAVDDCELERDRHANDMRLKGTWENIFNKYGQDFSGLGDEIDLETGQIVVNNGHIIQMRSEQDVGGGGARRLMQSFAADLDKESSDADDGPEEEANGIERAARHDRLELEARSGQARAHPFGSQRRHRASRAEDDGYEVDDERDDAGEAADLARDIDTRPQRAVSVWDDAPPINPPRTLQPQHRPQPSQGPPPEAYTAALQEFSQTIAHQIASFMSQWTNPGLTQVDGRVGGSGVPTPTYRRPTVPERLASQQLTTPRPPRHPHSRSRYPTQTPQFRDHAIPYHRGSSRANRSLAREPIRHLETRRQPRSGAEAHSSQHAQSSNRSVPQTFRPLTNVSQTPRAAPRHARHPVHSYTAETMHSPSYPSPPRATTTRGPHPYTAPPDSFPSRSSHQLGPTFTHNPPHRPHALTHADPRQPRTISNTHLAHERRSIPHRDLGDHQAEAPSSRPEEQRKRPRRSLPRLAASPGKPSLWAVSDSSDDEEDSSDEPPRTRRKTTNENESDPPPEEAQPSLQPAVDRPPSDANDELPMEESEWAAPIEHDSVDLPQPTTENGPSQPEIPSLTDKSSRSGSADPDTPDDFEEEDSEEDVDEEEFEIDPSQLISPFYVRPPTNRFKRRDGKLIVALREQYQQGWDEIMYYFPGRKIQNVQYYYYKYLKDKGVERRQYTKPITGRAAVKRLLAEGRFAEAEQASNASRVPKNRGNPTLAELQAMVADIINNPPKVVTEEQQRAYRGPYPLLFKSNQPSTPRNTGVTGAGFNFKRFIDQPTPLFSRSSHLGGSNGSVGAPEPASSPWPVDTNFEHSIGSATRSGEKSPADSYLPILETPVRKPLELWTSSVRAAHPNSIDKVDGFQLDGSSDLPTFTPSGCLAEERPSMTILIEGSQTTCIRHYDMHTPDSQETVSLISESLASFPGSNRGSPEESSRSDADQPDAPEGDEGECYASVDDSAPGPPANIDDAVSSPTDGASPKGEIAPCETSLSTRSADVLQTDSRAVEKRTVTLEVPNSTGPSETLDDDTPILPYLQTTRHTTADADEVSLIQPDSSSSVSATAASPTPPSSGTTTRSHPNPEPLHSATSSGHASKVRVSKDALHTPKSLSASTRPSIPRSSPSYFARSAARGSSVKKRSGEKRGSSGTKLLKTNLEQLGNLNTNGRRSGLSSLRASVAGNDESEDELAL